MARIARLVIPGLPHHVTQRGNGRQRTLFEEADYALHPDLLAEAVERALSHNQTGRKWRKTRQEVPAAKY